MDIEALRQQMNELLDEVQQLRQKVAQLENAQSSSKDGVSPPVRETNHAGKKSDLKGMIGLNDRFRFLNELFGSNSGEFNAAINQLDEMDSFEEAEDYLDRLSGVYQWDKKGHAYLDFYQLIKQKLSS